MFGVYYMEMVRRISRTFYSNSRTFLELFSWHQSVTTITMGPTVQSIAAENVALFQFWFSR